MDLKDREKAIRQAYPNCEKEAERSEEWNIIAMFFEWLSENKKLLLVRNETPSGWFHPSYQPVAATLNELMKLWHEYIGVDEAKLENERRQLLEELTKNSSDA